jgi:hypothetical protein
MFHPTLEPGKLSDAELDAKVKEVVQKINQASRMYNENLYNQLLAINNTLQLEVEKRKLAEAKKKDAEGEDKFDDLINVK